MSITLDGKAPTVRKPGDFKRRGLDGPPYVSCPSGDVVKSGARKGEPKWVLYGRPSGFAEQIEDKTNLVKWDEREIVYGMAAGLEDPDVRQAMNELRALPWDRDDRTWRSAADKVVVRAKEYAESGLAAAQGTHTHLTTEEHDRERDWVALAQRGVDLGIPQCAQAAMVAAWELMLTETGLEVLATELPVVHDGWRLAGTCDRIVRAPRDLDIADVRGAVTRIPAGTVFVLDIKTGKMRQDKGVVAYWHGYAVQIAAYADGVPYDLETDTRRCWTETLPMPSTDIAVIAHLPVTAALDGRAVCRLVAVDLQAGVKAAGIVLEAKSFFGRRDIFAVGINHEYSVDVTPSMRPATVPMLDPFDNLPTANDRPFSPVPTPRRIVSVVATPEHEMNGGEGPPMSDVAWAAIVGRVKALRSDAPQGYAVLESLIAACSEASPTTHGISRKVPSMRRHLIYRALLALAEHFGDELCDDHLRCIGLVIPDAQQIGVPIHTALLALTCAEAERFHRVALGVVTGEIALTFSNDGAALWLGDLDALAASPAA